MADQVTSSLPACIQVPGGLAVSPVQKGHRRGIKVDGVQLFTAVRIVTGVAGSALVIVEMSVVIGKVGEHVEAGDVGVVVVAFEAELLAIHAASTAGDRRVLGLSIEDMQAR